MGSLDTLLKGVSRSFYLSLRVLPSEIRPQLSLAYLLARASDTVADTKAVPKERRLDLLRLMRQGRAGAVAGLAPDQGLPAERELLERFDECMLLKASFAAQDRALIDKLLGTIVNGQIFDLERFPGEDGRAITALADDAELDCYTYLVAGCVGEFWTRLCAAHLQRLRSWDVDAMCALGERFGKGLQLVNVLRDIPRDLRIGRCYLPVRDPGALLDPARLPDVRPAFLRWLDRATDHLDAGWRYTLAIPPSLWRLRLACVWPIWIGLKTVALLRRGNPLDPDRHVMVPQRETNRLLARSLLTCWSDRLLSGAYARILAEARAGEDR
ncbi:MAG: squalene/phytoene synthase family protein [Elusimicrobia bacterium]|nr:squalene/phytoene synthase family protein [Elusimicrobiota bacterium]